MINEDVSRTRLRRSGSHRLYDLALVTVWLLLFSGPALAAVGGAAAGWTLPTVTGVLSGLLVLGMSPALAGHRLPRAGLAALGVAALLHAWEFPGAAWAQAQLIGDVLEAVCVVAAGVLLFVGTGISTLVWIGGLIYTGLLLGALAAVRSSYELMGELGSGPMYVAVETTGTDATGPLVLAAAALLVIGGRRDEVSRWAAPAA